MSFNQFRSDKASDSQYRKSGNRSGNTAASYQRTNSGKSSGGGGPAPPGSLQSSRSFKKPNIVQGGPSREGAPSVNPELNNAPAPTRNAQNGVHQQAPSREMADGPARTAAARITESPSTPSTNPADPKIMPLQSASGTSNPKLMQTPPKTEGGPPKGFSLQFGSISPGFVNGMQIPPRTTSAPPNLDEQKRDQARIEFSRPAPAVPIPSVTKQQLAVKESSVAKQKHPLVAVSHPLPGMKKETQAPSQAPISLPQKPSAVHVSGMPMPVPFHQPHGPVQFGVPPQVQPQVVPSTSLQMPPILSAGSSPLLQQPMFIPAIQPLAMQHHGIMHQGQGMNFSNQLRPQLSHQIGSQGINIGAQFTPPQAGKFNSPRRAVKITHPDTREELRLDRREDGIAGGPPKSGIHTGVLPPPQPVPSLRPAHPNGYYSTSFSSPYYPPPSVVHSIQITPNPQTARANHSNNQSHRNPILGNAEHFNLENTRNIPTMISSTAPSTLKEALSKMESVTAKVADVVYHSGSSIVKPVHSTNVTIDSAMVGSKNSTGRIDALVSARSPTSTPTEATSTYEVSVATISGSEANTNEAISGSSSIKDQQKKQSNKENFQSHTQVGGKTNATATLPLNDGLPRNAEGTTIVAFSGVIEAPSTNSVSPDASESPNHCVPAKTLNGESKERVECLQSEVSKQTSIDTEEETKDGVMSTNSSSVTIEVDLVPSAVSIANHDTMNNEADRSNTALELKDIASLSVAGFNDRAPLELSRPKSATAKGKKQKKELLQKADAAGSTSDLYTAYKGPGKKELTLSNESFGSGSGHVDLNKLPADTEEGIIAGKSEAQAKSEPENWEDAEDIMAPKLDIADERKSSSIGSAHDANEMRKYSKDFLMKFKDQWNILPEGFNVPSDVLRVLLAYNANLSNRDSDPSPGRGSDRSAGAARSDRRENLPVGDDKWNKGPGTFPSRDQRADFGYGNTMGGFKPGSGGNSGVLRYPRGQVPGQHPGGILSGPLQPLNTSQRDNADADRWQRGSNFQRGLIPSPQTPAQMMHKAEKKYERGRIADEEQAKQRQLKGILNKLTPQNFERLFEQVKSVNIDNAITLTGVISQIFDKALMEPTFCEMYADFCFHLAGELPDFTEGDEKITFRRVLLNKCQEEFERGEREQEEADRVEVEGEDTHSNEEREEKRVQARRLMLGNIRLIGELYKKKMLTERIMHECIKKLMGQHQNPDEEDIEALCKLMSTIGEMIDHPKAKEHMDAYFDLMGALSNNMRYSSRVRFMLKDSIDLRRNKWQQRRKVEGPKKIEEVHRDAAHERQAQSSRLTRGPSMNGSSRRGTPPDFGPRGSSILSSPISQTGGLRNFPSQSQRFGGTQDVRMEDRQPLYESRNMSVPLPQRAAGNETLTLGPQGGLGRGMSIRGAPPGQIAPSAAGLNGYRPANERPASSSNEDALPRSASGRIVVSAYNKSAGLNRNLSLSKEMRSSDSNADKPMATVPPLHDQSLPEERLRDMSLAAIKEFYSAKDEKEIALCIKDLNAPSYYPSMIALWVTDSFERKDMDRNLLTRLLVSLARAQDNTLNCSDLLKGFESVLSTLEDAVNDAPRAPEFLGRTFATVVVENMIPIQDIGQIVQNGGEERGSLLESGLAADVIGNILEAIQSAKGDSYLNEIRSSLRLQDFRPPNSLKSKKLEKFIQ
ncbi:unnamed protein product [Rhodiola kirilowii]